MKQHQATTPRRSLPERLLSLWRDRRRWLLQWHNAIRFRRAARRKNLSLTFGKGLLLDRKLVFRAEGSHCTVHIGDGVQSHGTSTLVVSREGSLHIGDGVYLNDGVMISCLGQVEIGDHTLIGPQVNIFDNNHLFGPQGVSRECRPGRVRVGKNCWIAANVILLDGACIGDNCVIGAGCIIRDDVPDGTIVTVHQTQSRHVITPRTTERTENER